MTEFFNIIFAAAFAAASCFPISVVTNEANPLPMTKAEFAEYCHSVHQNNSRATVLSDEDADHLLIQYAIDFDGDERHEIEAELNRAGIFIYTAGPENVPAPLSSSDDVAVSNVICSYNDHTGEWSLISGGSWLDPLRIREDIERLPKTGYTSGVGGRDTVGITIRGTSGTRPALTASFAAVYDEAGNTTRIQYPSTGVPSRGIAFEYQDSVTATAGANGSFHYMGYRFAAVMRFGSGFADWNGYARSFYQHTWKQAETRIRPYFIGVNVTWSPETHHFTALSAGDTRF